MWLSSTAQQALRAVVYLAEHATSAPVGADVVAQDLDLPRNYLSKTLHTLAANGVLGSRRGQGGGFFLARSPEQLTLAALVEPFGVPGPRQCLLSDRRCPARDPCAVHHRWSDASSRIDAFFSTTTVADLVSTEHRR